jgi:hypothetical protein
MFEFVLQKIIFLEGARTQQAFLYHCKSSLSMKIFHVINTWLSLNISLKAHPDKKST